MKLLGSFLSNFLIFSLYASVNLFPEDGTQTIKKWYYSPNILSDFYTDSEWTAVLSSFKKYGITPINAQMGDYFQDLALFTRNGELVLQHFPVYNSELTPRYEMYFKGFTQEIFTPPDWGTNYEVNLLTLENTANLKLIKKQLTHAFIEGGASISGRFPNGDDYLIVNHSTFLGMKYYYEDLFKGEIGEDELIQKIENEFNLKPGNFIYLVGSSHTHLDTYMKALPNGLILIDAPEQKLAMLTQLRKYTGNKGIDSYILYENQYRVTNYKYVVKKSKEQLKKRFKVVEVPGVFSRIYTNENGHTGPLEDINFFNGVSGSYQGRQFYITNKAILVPELERFWKMQLRNYGFIDVEFPGVYKVNAGLDCIGAPSP